ncbi:MAG: transposase-like protein [Cellvibrionaceae bacterium]|jgi:transposase-like protein
MTQKISQSFKIQAVEKALSRNSQTTIEEISKNLGVSRSSLYRWIGEAKHQQLGTAFLDNQPLSISAMPVEKRPSDWSQAEKMALIIRCGALDEEQLNALCREQGIYPHHVAQWKNDFLTASYHKGAMPSAVESKTLKQENKRLKKELNRKEKVLAEAAALLILQKKVNILWGNDEENSL